jgi:putative membrane protein
MNRTLACAAALTGLLLAGTSAAIADPPSREDFLKDAIKGDNSEIRLGGLAARDAGSPAVRAYGRTLVRDHTKAKAQASRVAERFGVSPPGGAMMKADAEYVKLKAMSGRSFDREFVSYMVDDHKQDIHDFREFARRHRGPVAQLAEMQLPTLQKHLDIAQSLMKR